MPLKQLLLLSYQTTTLTLQIGHLAVQLAQITNFDDLLDELIAKGEQHEDYRDDRIPYWADLWPSALALADYLVAKQLVSPGLRVTELGCGLALPGIVAGHLGGEVLLSDYLPAAVDFAAHNWSLNFAQPARTLLMDWRNPLEMATADLLLSSDVAYEARAFGDLQRTFATLVPVGGRIILTEPGRAIAQPFLRTIQQDPNFQTTWLQWPVSFAGRQIMINLLDLVRNEPAG